LLNQQQADFSREKDLAVLSKNIPQRNDEWIANADGCEIFLDTIRSPLLDPEGNVIGVLGISRDITESHQAQATQQESLEKYQLLFDSSRDALLTMSPPHWHFTEANAATLKMFGAATLSELTARGPEDLSPQHQPDGHLSSEKAQEKIAATLREGSSCFEWMHQKLDGTPFLADVSLTRITIAGEVFLHCAVRDISERKRLEDSAKLSNKQFSSIFQQAPLGIAVIDSYTGEIYEVNPRFAEIAGRTIEEMKNIDWMSITHPDDVKEDLDNMALLNARKIPGFTMDKRYLRPDGSIVWIRMTIVPQVVEDNISPRHLCMIDDITSHKQADKELADKEERFRSLVENIPGSTYRCLPDEQWSMLFISNEIEALSGHPSSDFIGENPTRTFAEIMHPDDILLISEKINQAISKKTFYICEYRVIDRQGLIHHVHDKGQAIYADDGSIRCLDGTIFDITERKQLELLERCRADIMEIIATKDVLADVLNSISLSVEQQNPDMLCSVLLLDDEGNHLLTGAAPSLPDFYNTAIHGMAIGKEAGSCGTAAFTGRRVIVNDIQTHPYWAPFKELAQKAELAACWSEPICSSKGKVLGTFAIYHRHPGKPTETDIKLIEQSAYLTNIAIEKHQARLALKSSEERWAFAIEGSGDGVWDWDIQTNKATYSKRWKEMLGYAEDEIIPINQEWVDRIHPEDREIVSGTMQAYLEGSLPIYVVTYRLRCKDDSYKWILGRGMVVRRDADNNPLRMVGTHTDITELKQTEEKLKLAASVFSHAREGITITDSEGLILDVNDTFSKVTGYSREEVLGKNPSMLQSGRQPPEFYVEMWTTLLREGTWTGEVWNRRKNGEVYAEQLTISAVHNSSTQETNFVALFTDITEQKTYQSQLQRMAHYDVLTNLPNRVLLADRLTLAMASATRNNRSIAVLFLDLDGFKAINDRHGHHVGDELLIAISQQLSESLRDGDTLSRVGGDEFVAVLTNIDKAQDCEPILERLLHAASEIFTVKNIALKVSVSIGVTIYPQDDADADVLVRHADQAMYVAKQEGKNRYHLFDTAQDMAVKAQREDLHDIRSALNNHEFVLYYQPKVNMRTGGVIGAEALIRWQHPDRGLVPPNDFLPVIENHELSIDLGEWVIDSALSQIAAWNTLGLDIPVSVNISAYQLQKEGFSERLAALLAAHPDADPSSLELEVLETSELGDVMQVSQIMTACIALGVSFALDDFGTGYASLTYLRRLPAHMIKIDQTFIRDMLNDPNDLAIVEGVLALAKSFKRGVIAEGVETIAHGSALLQLGCELAQGYGIARPMPAEDLPKWAAAWRPDRGWSS